jgi:kynureninase
MTDMHALRKGDTVLCSQAMFDAIMEQLTQTLLIPPSDDTAGSNLSIRFEVVPLGDLDTIAQDLLNRGWTNVSRPMI